MILNVLDNVLGPQGVLSFPGAELDKLDLGVEAMQTHHGLGSILSKSKGNILIKCPAPKDHCSYSIRRKGMSFNDQLGPLALRLVEGGQHQVQVDRQPVHDGHLRLLLGSNDLGRYPPAGQVTQSCRHVRASEMHGQGTGYGT